MCGEFSFFGIKRLLAMQIIPIGEVVARWKLSEARIV